ncbi:hypothetical protein AB7M29_001915 [Pseudomonas sp. F-14 TE3623]|nr:hypothetical protein [Pseudomonas farris]
MSSQKWRISVVSMSARNVILMAALPCATTGENTAEVKKTWRILT